MTFIIAHLEDNLCKRLALFFRNLNTQHTDTKKKHSTFTFWLSMFSGGLFLILSSFGAHYFDQFLQKKLELVWFKRCPGRNLPTSEEDRMVDGIAMGRQGGVRNASGVGFLTGSQRFRR